MTLDIPKTVLNVVLSDDIMNYFDIYSPGLTQVIIFLKVARFSTYNKQFLTLK